MVNNEIWHESNEIFFKALGDEAQLQALCHMKSHEEFSKRSRGYQLPIIILSVMCGSGNFVSTSFPENQDTIILGVGVLSIITSIISSIAQYLKLAEKSEAYRIAYVSWEKFYNNIRFQLSKRREEREDLKNYMSSITNEYQRLQEISPLLPDKITKSILWNKKKVIKQGMNVPVSLRNVKPTGWWDEEKGDIIINNDEHNTPLNFIDEEDDDEEDDDDDKSRRGSRHRKKRNKFDDGGQEIEEDVDIEVKTQHNKVVQELEEIVVSNQTSL
tara:strand:+ start:3028 stop:3843 length:816 start_codon:yes stop_codon:yes gene_type:complete